jgi:hypothetical protein
MATFAANAAGCREPVFSAKCFALQHLGRNTPFKKDLICEPGLGRHDPFLLRVEDALTAFWSLREGQTAVPTIPGLGAAPGGLWAPSGPFEALPPSPRLSLRQNGSNNLAKYED